MDILPDLYQVHLRSLACDAEDDSCNIFLIQADGRFCYDHAPAMAEKNLNRNPGIVLYGVGEIHQGSRYPVGHLIRMARIHFLVHFCLRLYLSVELIDFFEKQSKNSRIQKLCHEDVLRGSGVGHRAVLLDYLVDAEPEALSLFQI